MDSFEREIIIIHNEQELLIYKKNGKEIKYRVFQIYGQKYIKKLECVLIPENWSEIYVTNIPRDIPVENLFLYFSQCGEIYQLRLLMDFSGFNRGHCFIQYQNVEASRAAICCLHDEEIASGYRLVIKLSLNNNQLIIKNLPSFVSERYVTNFLYGTVGEGLTGVTLRPSRIPSRSYCFCTYQDHQFAVMAHKKIWPFINIAGYIADVHWAVPELLRYGTNLYFTNLPENLTKKEFFTVLKNKVDIKSVIQFRINDIFGFITFANRMYLHLGEASLKDVMIRGRMLVFSRIPFHEQFRLLNGIYSQHCDNEINPHFTPQNIRPHPLPCNVPNFIPPFQIPGRPQYRQPRTCTPSHVSFLLPVPYVWPQMPYFMQRIPDPQHRFPPGQSRPILQGFVHPFSQIIHQNPFPTYLPCPFISFPSSTTPSVHQKDFDQPPRNLNKDKSTQAETKDNKESQKKTES